MIDPVPGIPMPAADPAAVIDNDDAAGSLFVRGAQWAPILLFHLGLYLQNPEAGWAVLEAGNPLYDAVPADVLAAFFVVFESLCAVGDIAAGDVEALMRELGAVLTHPPTEETTP